MVYVAKDSYGQIVNTIVIEPEQISEYESLTGFTLEIPPEAEGDASATDLETMEAALNELGVITRE